MIRYLLLFFCIFAQFNVYAQSSVADIDQIIRDACVNIDGVSIGKLNDKSTWRIDFNSNANANCRLSAQTAINNITLVPLKNVIPFSTFIERFTNAEYVNLMQKRAAAIASENGIAFVKQWDISLVKGKIDLNTNAAQSFKAALVNANILTQVRADAIFQ